MCEMDETIESNRGLTWQLCMQGWRSARIYTVNGVCLFASWLFARIILFMWFFKHMWQHRSDIADLRTEVMVLILTVPPLLFILNVFWFGKIVRGLVKLLKGQLAKVMSLPKMLYNGDTTSTGV